MFTISHLPFLSFLYYAIEGAMGTHDSVKRSILSLIAQDYGEKVGAVFAEATLQDTFPIFLHNTFLLLRDLVGKAKAREQIDSVLDRYNIVVPYE